MHCLVQLLQTARFNGLIFYFYRDVLMLFWCLPPARLSIFSCLHTPQSTHVLRIFGFGIGTEKFFLILSSCVHPSHPVSHNIPRSPSEVGGRGRGRDGGRDGRDGPSTDRPTDRPNGAVIYVTRFVDI